MDTCSQSLECINLALRRAHLLFSFNMGYILQLTTGLWIKSCPLLFKLLSKGMMYGLVTIEVPSTPWQQSRASILLQRNTLIIASMSWDSMMHQLKLTLFWTKQGLIRSAMSLTLRAHLKCSQLLQKDMEISMKSWIFLWLFAQSWTLVGQQQKSLSKVQNTTI